MSGISPLTYTTIEAWSRLMAIDVEPHEVEALIVLDSIKRFPEVDEEEKKEQTAPKTKAWPSKKNAPEA